MILFSQIYPGSVELMQVIEEFIHIVGLGMKDFHNAYLMTGNLGKRAAETLPPATRLADSSRQICVSSVIEDKWCMEGANNCQSIMLIKIKPFPLNVLNSNANSLILFQLGKEESVFGFSYVYCSLLWFSFSKTKSFGPLPDCFFIYVHKVGPLKDKAWLVHFPINLPWRWKEFSAKCRLAHEYWSPFHSFEQNQS